MWPPWGAYFSAPTLSEAGGKEKRGLNFCPSIRLLAPVFMFKNASAWMINYMAPKCLESDSQDISWSSNTPEPLASSGGYQSCKNVHCPPVVVVLADVILLFAQVFSSLILGL